MLLEYYVFEVSVALMLVHCDRIFVTAAYVLNSYLRRSPLLRHCFWVCEHRSSLLVTQRFDCARLVASVSFGFVILVLNYHIIIVASICQLPSTCREIARCLRQES